MDALSRLIGQIYDAVVNPALWTAALIQTCIFTDTERAILIHEDGLVPTNSQFQISYADPVWERLYLDTYMMINPARLARGRLVQSGDIVLTSDYMSEQEYARTKFYQEFLSMRDCVDLATAILDVTATSFTVLGVLRNESQGPADAEVRQRLALIAPHFRRAVTLSNLFERREMLSDSLIDTLDTLKAGVFVLADDAVVVHTNESAKRMLLGDRALHISHGKLIAHDVAAQAALAESVAAASRGDAALGSTDTSILFRSRGERSFMGTLMALKEGSPRWAGLGLRAVATLCLREASQEAPTVAPAIAELYELTPREMTVLTTIVENTGVADAAYILGLSEGTIKSHLKSIFRKTGAARQADLVKLVAGVANPFQGS